MPIMATMATSASSLFFMEASLYGFTKTNVFWCGIHPTPSFHIYNKRFM
jgi:hypothetical protein